MRELIGPVAALAVASAIAVGGSGIAWAQDYPPVPPPMVEAAPPAPPVGGTYIWEPGHWQWTGTTYAWVGGHYVVREPAWRAFVPGHWENTGAAWVWVPGHWT